MSAPLLELHNLRIAFNGREVVHGIDLTLQAGEKWALVGESGSGKSVTALSVLRLAQGAQVSGSCRFEGQDVLAMNPARLQALRGAEIAMIFQEPMTALNPLFSIGAPIENRGLSAVMGSWKIMAISAPRRACRRAGFMASTSCPSKRQLPLTCAPWARRSTLSAVTDFPEPDSPTNAHFSPACNVRSMPCTTSRPLKAMRRLCSSSKGALMMTCPHAWDRGHRARHPP